MGLRFCAQLFRKFKKHKQIRSDLKYLEIFKGWNPKRDLIVVHALFHFGFVKEMFKVQFKLPRIGQNTMS